jgi:hypothetical protein
MPYILMILAALILAVILSTACCRKAPTGTGGTISVTASATMPGSRADIAKRLANLAKTPPPTGLSMGAMCYIPAGSASQSINFICPVCGGKTVYARNRGSAEERLLDRESESIAASEARRLVGMIPLVTAELDESQFCRHCAPEVTTPVLILIIKYPDGSQAARTQDVSLFDILLLTEFLGGKDRIIVGAGREQALQDFLPRIQELLGMKAE